MTMLWGCQTCKYKRQRRIHLGPIQCRRVSHALVDTRFECGLRLPKAPTVHVNTVSKSKGDPKILKRGPTFEKKRDPKFNFFGIVHQERSCLSRGSLIEAVFVYLHARHSGLLFLRSSYQGLFKNISYVWPSLLFLFMCKFGFVYIWDLVNMGFV